jgi:hypothetical protein
MIFLIFFFSLFEMELEIKDDDELEPHKFSSDLDIVSSGKIIDDTRTALYSPENGGESVMISDTEDEMSKEKRSLSRTRGNTIEINTNIDQSSFIVNVSSDDEGMKFYLTRKKFKLHTNK